MSPHPLVLYPVCTRPLLSLCVRVSKGPMEPLPPNAVPDVVVPPAAAESPPLPQDDGDSVLVGAPDAAAVVEIYDLRSERKVLVEKGRDLNEYWGRSQWHSHGVPRKEPERGPQSISELRIPTLELARMPLYALLQDPLRAGSSYAAALSRRIERLANVWRDLDRVHSLAEDASTRDRRRFVKTFMSVLEREQDRDDAKLLSDSVYQAHGSSKRSRGPRAFILTRTYLELSNLVDRLAAAHAHAYPHLFAHTMPLETQIMLKRFFAAEPHPPSHVAGPDCHGNSLGPSFRNALGFGGQRHVLRRYYAPDSSVELSPHSIGGGDPATPGDPIHNAGIVGNEFACCGLPRNHPGCFTDTYSTTTNQPVKYRAIWGKLWQPDLFDPTDETPAAMQRVWIRALRRGTAWIDGVPYDGIHNRIVQLKSALAPHVIAAITEADSPWEVFQMLGARHLNMLVKLLRLEAEYNSYFCKSSRDYPGSPLEWFTKIGGALRLDSLYKRDTVAKFVSRSRGDASLSAPVDNEFAAVFKRDMPFFTAAAAADAEEGDDDDRNKGPVPLLPGAIDILELDKEIFNTSYRQAAILGQLARAYVAKLNTLALFTGVTEAASVLVDARIVPANASPEQLLAATAATELSRTLYAMGPALLALAHLELAADARIINAALDQAAKRLFNALQDLVDQIKKDRVPSGTDVDDYLAYATKLNTLTAELKPLAQPLANQEQMEQLKDAAIAEFKTATAAAAGGGGGGGGAAGGAGGGGGGGPPAAADSSDDEDDGDSDSDTEPVPPGGAGPGSPVKDVRMGALSARFRFVDTFLTEIANLSTLIQDPNANVASAFWINQTVPPNVLGISQAIRAVVLPALGITPDLVNGVPLPQVRSVQTPEIKDLSTERYTAYFAHDKSLRDQASLATKSGFSIMRNGGNQYAVQDIEMYQAGNALPAESVTAIRIPQGVTGTSTDWRALGAFLTAYQKFVNLLVVGIVTTVIPTLTVTPSLGALLASVRKQKKNADNTVDKISDLEDWLTGPKGSILVQSIIEQQQPVGGIDDDGLLAWDDAGTAVAAAAAGLTGQTPPTLGDTEWAADDWE